MVKLSDAQATANIKAFMLEQNRPFSIQNVMDAMRGQIKKVQCTHCLDTLCEQGVLTRKEYGKQKVYLANQTQFESMDSAAIDALEKKAKQLQQEKTSMKEAVSLLDAKCNRLAGLPTNDELATEVGVLKAEVSAKETKLEGLQGGMQLVTPEMKEKVEKRFTFLLKEYKSRKRNCNEMIAQICENSSKKPTKFAEDVGIETDEEVGFNVKDLLAEPPQKKQRR